MIRIRVVFGARPEAIKRAPVVKALRRAGTFAVRVGGTALDRRRTGAAGTVGRAGAGGDDVGGGVGGWVSRFRRMYTTGRCGL